MFKAIQINILVGIFSLGAVVSAQTMSNLAEGMTQAEKIEAAASLVDEAADAVEATVELAETVQDDEGDVTQLRCVNDSLVSMNGFLQVAEEASDELATAGLPDVDQDHHYRLVVISHQRVMALRSEARQCAGEAVRYTGGAQTESGYDGIVPTEDQAAPDSIDGVIFEGVVVDRIPPASPGV